MTTNLLDPEMKKMFRNNIIKFVIGIWLLSVCFLYLQKHPAEKDSVFSGFEMMYQKGTIRWHKAFYTDADALEKKYNLQKYYQELIRTSEDCKGIDVNVLGELTTSYNGLKELKGKSLETDLAEYIRLAYKYDTVVKDTCE